jgi:hypothetical protein
VIETNVCDGLFAIANAINRLAAVNEKSLAAQEQGMVHGQDRQRNTRAAKCWLTS